MNIIKNRFKCYVNLFIAGEDGQVKIWSRSGMLRSTLTQNSMFIHKCLNYIERHIINNRKIDNEKYMLAF